MSTEVVPTQTELLYLEVIRAVESLSKEMIPTLESSDSSRRMVPLEYQGYFGGIRVSFLGEIIWSSEESMRDYNEETNTWEPLEDYLVRKMDEILRGVSKLDFSKHFEDQQG